MVHSALVYREVPADRQPTRATVIPLHGNPGSLDDLVPLARTLGEDIRIEAPEAARGVHDSKHFVVGHSWYGGIDQAKPEPASFGDSLAQVERFIMDVHDRATPGAPTRPWLLGYGQGAVMSLAATGILSDRISGAIAICGTIPEIRNWEALPEGGNDLPILLISDPDDLAVPTGLVRQSETRLRSWGASVTHLEIEDACAQNDRVTAAVRDWLNAQTVEHQEATFVAS